MKSTSAPSLLPIHSRCMALMPSGQSSSSRSSNSRSAYCGDLQHPLAHHAFLDRVAGLDVLAVFHFFVGEHGAERRAPVHRRFDLVGQAALVEHLEDPLGPLVVLGIGGVDFAVPVVGKAKHLDLAAEGVAVLCV